MKKALLFSILTLCGFATLPGCGYTLRNSGSHSPVLQKAGIHRIFIAPVVNNSFKAGIEITVYNALQKRVGAEGEVKIVQNEKDADAVIHGQVLTAEYLPVSYTTGSNLEPKSLGNPFQKLEVATVYNAKLVCYFSLVTKKQKNWGSQFERTKSFGANNQLGPVGTTSAIINDSEFERALNDLADSMMGDVHESLLTMF